MSVNIPYRNIENTVDGRNSAPVEVGSLSRYLQGFYTVVVWDFFHQPYGPVWNILVRPRLFVRSTSCLFNKIPPLRASDVNSVTEAIRAAQVVFEEDGNRVFETAGNFQLTFNGESLYRVQDITILGT